MTPPPDLTDDVLGRQCLEMRDRIRAMFEEARVAAAVWDLPATPPRRTRNG